MPIGHPDYFRQSAFSQFGAFAFNQSAGNITQTANYKMLDLDGRGSIYNLYWLLTSTVSLYEDSIILEIDGNICNGIFFNTELVYGYPYTEGFYFKNSYLASDYKRWCGCITQVLTFADNITLYYKAKTVTSRTFGVYFLWGRNRED